MSPSAAVRVQRDDCVKCAMTRVNDPEHGLVHPRPFHCNAQLEKYFSCVERVAGCAACLRLRFLVSLATPCNFA